MKDFRTMAIIRVQEKRIAKNWKALGYSRETGLTVRQRLGFRFRGYGRMWRDIK